MMLRKISILGLIICILAGCSKKASEELLVEGSFTGAAGEKIMLAELPFNSNQRLVLDSATLDSSGKFKLSTLQQDEGMYQLFIQDGPGLLFINDTTDIYIHANVDSLDHYVVKNSQASKSIQSLFERVTELQEKSNQTRAIADSISRLKIADSLKLPAIQIADRSYRNIGDFLISYLRIEKNGTALWYGLGVASRFLTKEEWATALERAAALHRNNAGIAMMKASLAVAQQQDAEGRALLNKPIANITLPDTSGKPVSVSDYRGKWLLIDFWASWCAPCRADNPNLVATYRKFRNKKFDILGVSLDNDRAAWIKAIAMDSLQWKQVSDLKQWDSEAVGLYGFTAIPFNVLIDTSGKAVAVNLHGEALAEKLKMILP